MSDPADQEGSASWRATSILSLSHRTGSSLTSAGVRAPVPVAYLDRQEGRIAGQPGCARAFAVKYAQRRGQHPHRGRQRRAGSPLPLRTRRFRAHPGAKGGDARALNEATDTGALYREKMELHHASGRQMLLGLLASARGRHDAWRVRRAVRMTAERSSSLQYDPSSLPSAMTRQY